MNDTVTENQPSTLELLNNAISVGDNTAIIAILQPLASAQIALLIEALPSRERTLIWELLDPSIQGEVLTYINDTARMRFIDEMDNEQLVAAAENLQTDDLADLLPDMPDQVILQILSSLDEQNRRHLEAVLNYSDDSAGGLMNRDTVTVRPDITVDVVLRYLRMRQGLPETTDRLMVINREGLYLGTLPLATLLTSSTEDIVEEIMDTTLQPVVATASIETVIKLFEHRDLVSAPVIDESGMLAGRITIDDVVDEIRESADHDFLGRVGMNEEEDIFAPVLDSSRRRTVWLGINLLTALLASWIIGFFDATIEQLVALAVLMPVVASMGGIAGSQTLTLVIRAMALGQIENSNSMKLMRKELAVGFINGILWALVIALITMLWFQSSALGAVIATAIVINLLTAALAGAVIPLILKHMGIDPALAGSVVLTTVTDVVGFFTFLGLASIFLVNA